MTGIRWTQHVSEAAFTAQVINLARWYKWRVVHFRPGMTKRGRWVTAVQGDGVGFPDLFMVRASDKRIVAAELKSANGKPTQAQLLWISDMLVAGVEAFIWRPADINEIEEILK